MHHLKEIIPMRPIFAILLFVVSLPLATLAAADLDDYPEPLPPPPELLNEAARIAEDAAAISPSVNPYAPRIVYTAPDAVDPALAAQMAPPPELLVPEPTPLPGGTVRIPVEGGGYVSRGFVVSPPSTTMPADYFDLPMNENAIPGVLLPEMDIPAASSRPARRGAPAAPVKTGMTMKQLDPFFALAKGSEGAALNARSNGDNAAYYDQLGKARAAYQEIVSMADAGSEAREEAWYGIARCDYRLGNWWKAFEALERSFPEEYQAGEVAGRMKLETYIGERLWRFGASPAPDVVVDGVNLDGYRAAAQVYAAVMFNQPTNDDAPLALLRQGDAASFHNEWDEAARHYRTLIEYYPDSEQAMQARASLAESIYRQDWPTGMPEAARRDVQGIMEDVDRADTTLSIEAADRRRKAVGVANERDAEIKLRHAKEYLKSVRGRKSRDGAVFLLKDVVSLYPETSQAAEAADILASLGVESPLPATGGVQYPFGQPTSEYDATGSLAEDIFGGGYVTLDVPSAADIPSFGGLPNSPTRETVYESWPDPLTAPVE